MVKELETMAAPDITERLRHEPWVPTSVDDCRNSDLRNEAADEIERLREALAASFVRQRYLDKIWAAEEEMLFSDEDEDDDD